MTIFKPVSSKVSFPEMEERILRSWRERDMLRQVEQARKDAPPFTLYEGPPTANGKPGIHHVLARVFKDVIPRYKTMQGFRPVRQGGWDTHGLPVELEIEKELGISSKREIEEYGIERFNALCRESVMRYVKEFEELTDRIGFWVDMPNAYVTFKNDYIETGWWIIKQLWERGLLYEGFRVAPHCPRCVTTLSSHEVALGYQEDTPDPSVYVRFRLSDRQGTAYGGSGAALAPLGYNLRRDAWEAERPFMLAWTTTPWTLTANVALAVNPDEEYVLAQAPSGQVQERLIIAKARKDAVLGAEWQELTSFKGDELRGLYYEPLYPTAERGYIHHVVTADFVSMEDGTGIVHTAPAYGGEDMELGRANGLPTLHTVDLQGNLAAVGLPGSGKFVKEADEDVMRDLEQRGLLYRREVIRHTYPFCWRCNTPLLYYAKSSWYIKTTAMKDRLISGNQEINWYPDYIKEGRFGEWLRGNVDWALSRERYWGTPMPVWKCSNCGESECFGSVAALRARAQPGDLRLLNAEHLDIHRPYIDRVGITCQKCGGTMRRIPDVMDAWFDSGAMPFAQSHVMSDDDLTKLKKQHLFPADYICEAVDQTRGWFYTLHALSTLIAGEPSYRNVICLGLILDAKGEKMSKSKGNVADPWAVINAHGADALRWYMFTAAPPGNSRRFSADLVSESVRRFFLPLWNVYSFFVTYANIDGFNPGSAPAPEPASDLDRWIRSEMEQLVKEVTELLEEYNPTDAARRIEDFVDVLSDWYVRRSRRRFWKSENDQDKLSAYNTLYTCLTTLAKLLAPFAPFVSEEMHRNLVLTAYSDAPESVHLAGWPKADESLIDKELSEAMRLARRVASLGRAARSKAGIRVRQPLALLHVITKNPLEEPSLERLSDQLRDELNVKQVTVLSEDSDREVHFWDWRATLNMAKVGPKYGRLSREIGDALARLDAKNVAEHVKGAVRLNINGATFPIRLRDSTVELALEEVSLTKLAPAGFSVVEEGDYVVAIATELTPALAEEGMARELVHLIQNMRRSAGFEIADRIVTTYQGDERIARVIQIQQHGDYIRQETLSVELRPGEPPAGNYTEEHKIDGVSVKLGVRRTG
ncbi:MAG: isoleucine--tRNA ligase [Dehalococcoidia bacterium]|nr:isoleucine--tRNA ligase [Dehalococcoidia bacterium]